MKHNARSYDGDLLVSTADGMAVEEIEKYLIDRATRAEVMEYLGHTYGPVFVMDLIKHLHDPTCRSATENGAMTASNAASAPVQAQFRSLSSL